MHLFLQCQEINRALHAPDFFDASVLVYHLNRNELQLSTLSVAQLNNARIQRHEFRNSHYIQHMNEIARRTFADLRLPGPNLYEQVLQASLVFTSLCLNFLKFAFSHVKALIVLSVRDYLFSQYFKKYEVPVS